MSRECGNFEPAEIVYTALNTSIGTSPEILNCPTMSMPTTSWHHLEMVYSTFSFQRFPRPDRKVLEAKVESASITADQPTFGSETKTTHRYDRYGKHLVSCLASAFLLQVSSALSEFYLLDDFVKQSIICRGDNVPK